MFYIDSHKMLSMKSKSFDARQIRTNVRLGIKQANITAVVQLDTIIASLFLRTLVLYIFSWL